ncbi:MAG: arsenic resistance N-acetyltransferase ArsN2 [Candidatus Thorarchaeota archaeon]|jgi:amino-acid N-acetyltransferase
MRLDVLVTGYRIERTSPSELSWILSLLNDVDLPSEGVKDHISNFLSLRSDDDDPNLAPWGCVGLEIYGDSALLRSMAISPEHQGKGLGTVLTKAIIEDAQEKGIKTLFLLTDTAEDFFRRFGFRVVEREHVPDDVKTSIEFTKLCLEAPAMMLKI